MKPLKREIEIKFVCEFGSEFQMEVFQNSVNAYLQSLHSFFQTSHKKNNIQSELTHKDL